MRRTIVFALICAVGFLSNLGCEPKKKPGVSGNTAMATKKDDHDDHHHDEEGPNGGHIIDIAGHHAEWTHDTEAKTVTLYLEELASHGDKIESAKIDVTMAGTTKSFELKPDESAKIKGSVFNIKDAELIEMLGAAEHDSKTVVPKLVLMVDGKSESCVLECHHDDHAGHKH